jgi:uncharacterized repeat protein (TIGR01451 family)
MGLRRIVATVGAVALVLLTGLPALADPLPVDEPFTGTSFADPAWVLPAPSENLAHLTGDALQLAAATPPPGLIAGNATLDDPFRSDVAFTAEFDYAAYGGANPGDAMTFFLMSGAQPPGLGGGGGSAGYDAMQGGYIAVGLADGPNFGEAPTGNIVVLRGAANAAPKQWPVLTYEPAPGGTIASLPTDPRHVRILVEPNGSTSNFLSVWVDDTTGNPVLVYDRVDIVGLGSGQPSRPATFKMGFSAGIAGATNNYEVTNFVASADVDLSVVKTGPSIVYAGDEASWQVVVSNDDTNPVSDVVLTDAIPAGVTDVTWTCETAAPTACPLPAQGTAVGGVVTVDLNLLRAETATVTITGTVTDAAAASTLSNTATVTAASRTELVPADNSSTVTTRVRALPDLAPTVDVTVAPITYGSPVTWTVDVDNLAAPDGDAPDASLDVAVPPLIDRASITPPAGCVATTDGFTCTLGPLAAQGNVALSFTGDATNDIALCTAGSSTFAATVSSSVTDADPANDSDSVAVACVVPVDLSVVKTGPATARLGDDVTYTVVATNSGAYPSSPTTVTDDLPASLSDAAWRCTVSDGTECTPASGTGDVSATADVPAGGSITVEVTATAGALGDIVNTAAVDGCPACTDADATDDQSSVTTVVLARPDLAPTVTVAPDPLQLGQPVTWTVDVENLATVDGSAPDAAVEVSLPAPIDRTTIVPPAGCVASAAGFDCALGTLAESDSTSLSFTGTVTDVSACLAGPSTFRAEASTSVNDADPSNDVDAVAVACTVPVDLTITKSAPADATAGEAITYTIVATNVGDVVAPDTVVTDVLPAGLTEATWTCTVSDGSACSPAAGTGDVEAVATLEPGESMTVLVSANPDESGTVTNTATVTPCELCTGGSGAQAASATTAVAAASPPIASTGADAAAPLAWALSLLLTGGALVAARRRLTHG